MTLSVHHDGRWPVHGDLGQVGKVTAWTGCDGIRYVKAQCGQARVEGDLAAWMELLRKFQQAATGLPTGWLGDCNISGACYGGDTEEADA